MATYNLKFNKDDSVIRHVIVGLLADLNKNVSFYRQVDNDTRAEIDVPFYYSPLLGFLPIRPGETSTN